MDNLYMNGNGNQMPQYNPMMNQQPLFVRIDGDKIVQAGAVNGQLIGYTVKAYEDLVKIAEEQEKMLIDHGIIQKEKTPEEAMQDLSEKIDSISTKLVGAIESLSDRIIALEKKESAANEAKRTKAGTDGR